jgi:hypothetical protein
MFGAEMKIKLFTLLVLTLAAHASTNSPVAVNIFFKQNVLTPVQLEFQARAALKARQIILSPDYKVVINVNVAPRQECTVLFTKGLKDPFYVVKFDQAGKIADVRGAQKPKMISPEFLTEEEKKQIEDYVREYGVKVEDSE